jgi:hypothetical protein
MGLLKEYRVPSHIVRHSVAAAKMGVFLGERLRAARHDVDVALVDRACLLHDLMRACDFKLQDFSRFEEPVSEETKAFWRRLKERYDGRGHEYAAYDVLKGKWPELAVVIRRHKYVSPISEEDRPQSWEDKLVYYADKRAMHDVIVPLQERLDEAHARSAAMHGTSKEREEKIAVIDALIFEMEKEIFDEIGIEADLVDDRFIDSFVG